MPRDVSLSDSKCWNGGHEWFNILGKWERGDQAGLLCPSYGADDYAAGGAPESYQQHIAGYIF